METKYTGEIKGFPREVVERMLDHQEKQSNKRDVAVFEKDKDTSKYGGGFWWDETEEGVEFWEKIITHNDFNVFFEKYPKELKKLVGYRLKEHKYYKAAAVLCHAPLFEKYFSKTGEEYNILACGNYKVILEEAGVLDLWFEPVYESVGPNIIKMQSATGEFELEVSKEGIYYAPDKAWLDANWLDTLCTMTYKLPASRKDGTHQKDFVYDVAVTHVDVGCKKHTLVSDWKKVLDAYALCTNK